jgi:hypothetical protein
MTSKFIALLKDRGVKPDSILYILNELDDIVIDDQCHPKIFSMIQGLVSEDKFPSQIITQASVYYKEESDYLRSLKDTKEEEPHGQESQEEETPQGEETELNQDHVLEPVSDLDELAKTISFQKDISGFNISNQAKRISLDFPELNIGDIRDIKLIEDIKGKTNPLNPIYCLWESLELIPNSRNKYSTVICNQNGIPMDAILKKGFPGRFGKATVGININDYVIHGELCKGYLNFYIFKILQFDEKKDKNINLAQYKLMFKSYNQYTLQDIGSFPSIWIFNPRTFVMQNTINEEILNEIRNGYLISFTNVIQHLVENLTSVNFKSDNDPNFYLTIYGKLFKSYKPKNIYRQEWLDNRTEGSRIFLYSQLTSPNAHKHGMYVADTFSDLFKIIFDNWIIETKANLVKQYPELYVPLFLDMIVQPMTSSNIDDLTSCLVCQNNFKCTSCAFAETENAFLNIIFSISIPKPDVIQKVYDNVYEKSDMYRPCNIMIKRAGTSGIFGYDYNNLPGTLKAQLFPIGTCTWYGLIKSFGDLNHPSPIFSRFKLR